MRVFIAISIVVASVSSASAQLATDHGNAADAKAAATASGAPQFAGQQINSAWAVAARQRSCGGLPSI